MIDLNAEKPITLREATQLPFLRINGRAPHVSKLYRWISPGVDGVRLEFKRIGRVKCVTREAVLRFIEGTSNPHAKPTNPRTPGQRQRAIERAERELDRDGI